MSTMESDKGELEQKSSATTSNEHPASSSDRELVRCSFYSRTFLPDRIGVNEQICAKSSLSYREAYSSATHRAASARHRHYVVFCGARSSSQTSESSVPKVDWRKQYNDFVQTLPSARGSKRKDIPSAPLLDTSDLVQCPHCGKQRSKAAAGSHIQNCDNMQLKKPKRAPGDGNRPGFGHGTQT